MEKSGIGCTIRDIFLIILGAVAYAAGFQFFYYQNDIITGGVTGIAMVINYLTSAPVGALILSINVPLFIIAWRQFGFRALIKSVLGMTVSSVLVDVFALMPVNVTDNLLLACLYGGLFMGAGLGVIYLTGATTGGVDIIAKLVRRRRQHINFGTIMLIMDAVIITAFAIFFKKYESAMYALIGLVVCAYAIDAVLYGLNTSKTCYIISDKSEILTKRITAELDRGITILNGEGAYTGSPKRVIFCVIKKQQIADARRIIKEVDPTAFMVVSDAKDVFGDGFADITSDH